MPPNTKQADRIKAEAKKENKFIDCTYRRGVESLIWLDDGKLLGCAFTPGTVLRRLNNAVLDKTDDKEMDNDDQD